MLNISDFNISGKPIPQDVADAIVKYHLLDLIKLEDNYNIGLKVSLRSGYRPVWWEKGMGRKGDSPHTFQGENGKEKGAVDLTCTNFTKNKDVLLEALINCTSYTRFAVYRSFIHCDHISVGGKRVVYNSKWERVREF